MLALLRLPLELLQIAFTFLLGIFDVFRGCKRRRFESRVFIKAPRDAVWRLVSADRIVFDGPPLIEMIQESLAEADDLKLVRVSVAGQEISRIACRILMDDAVRGTSLIEIVPHERSLPPAEGKDYYAGLEVKEASGGTSLALYQELTFGSFGQRIKVPLAVRHQVARIKRQCEKEAGTQSRLVGLANNGLVLSLLALASFWYLMGWREALLIALIVLLHELGHVAAMRMTGIAVQGIYLIPFFGGAAVPKTAYRSQGQLGFVALMGPGFSLVPTLALGGLYYATGDSWLLHAAFTFAFINGLNLLPIYPLDGGLILNAVFGSLSRHLTLVVRWGGVLTGLGAALHFKSLLLGVPFLLFALQLYLSGGRSSELRRLSLLSGTALVLTFAATFALYLAFFAYASNLKSILAGQSNPGPLEARFGIPVRCDLPASSGDVLDRFLSERGALAGLSLVRILAAADRAGDGAIVMRWLEAPSGFDLPHDLAFATEARVSHWLALAKSGSLAAIEAEATGEPASRRSTDLRDLFTTALIVHGRYQEALALMPPSAESWRRSDWLQSTLVALVSARAIDEAVSLLERTRSETVDKGEGRHVRALAQTLQRIPAAQDGKEALVAVIADQLHRLQKSDRSNLLPACAPSASPACTGVERKRLARDVELALRADEIELLANFDRLEFHLPNEFLSDPGRWWHLFAVVAAYWAEHDTPARAEALRSVVAEAFAARATNDQGTKQADPQRDLDESAELQTSSDFFEIAYAATRVSLSLRRGDVAKAEALAEAAAQRFRVPLSIRTLMVDHYLWAGDWQRADAWSRRNIPPAPVASAEDEDLLEERLEAQAWLEQVYPLSLAAAAVEKGETALANSALERARTKSCELAKSSAYLRNEWPTFLQRAYLLKAVQEGRLPSNALDRPS